MQMVKKQQSAAEQRAEQWAEHRRQCEEEDRPARSSARRHCFPVMLLCDCFGLVERAVESRCAPFW